MRVEFLLIAKSELDDAVKYYNLQVDGLGNRYKNEAQSTIKRISIFPMAYIE